MAYKFGKYKSKYFSSRYFSSNLIRKAKKRNLPFEITPAYVDLIFERQDFKCAYTGIDLVGCNDFSDARQYEKTASVDRIDSSKGYVKDNIQIVHKVVNMMKGNMSDDDFKMWCFLVANNQNHSISFGNIL